MDSDDEIARRWSDSIPVLFVNGRLFAKLRIPKLARAAAPDARGRGRGGTPHDRNASLLLAAALSAGPAAGSAGTRDRCSRT